jgi:hypothetical protein
MAVDYFHGLIVTGPPPQLQTLRRRLTRTLSRTVRGRTWSDRLPFSIGALYDIAPEVRRIDREPPGETYDVRVWPITGRAGGPAELRYLFHTRNFEVCAFLKPISRRFPRLTFRLATQCLDDGDFVSFQIVRGHARRWRLPQQRHDVHWELARQKFRLSADDVYEDEDAERFAEDGMRDESLDHWVRESAGRKAIRRRPWWNRPPARDFMTDRELDLYAYAELLEESDQRQTSTPTKASKRSSTRDTERRAGKPAPTKAS